MYFETPSDYASWQLSLYYFGTEPSLVSGAMFLYDSLALGLPGLPGAGGYIEASGSALKATGKICKFGADDKVIVVGQGSERVMEAAKAIGAKFYSPVKSIQETGVAKALKNNYNWLKHKVEKGYLIIDIGFDGIQKTGKGLFYKMEDKWLRLWGIKK